MSLRPPRAPIKPEQKREKKKKRCEAEEGPEGAAPATAAAVEAVHLRDGWSSTAAAPPMKLTKYERVQVLGSRACALAAGADPLLPVPGALDPLAIAMEELERGLLASKVVRTHPNGEQTVHPLQTLM